MKSLIPVLHDFRKAFLKPAILVLLPIFIVLGIAMSYFVMSIVSQQYPATNIIAIAIYNGSICEAHGYIYDVTGNPTSGELVVMDQKGSVIYSKNLDSYFSISGDDLCKLFSEESIRIQLKSGYGKYDVNLRRGVVPSRSGVGEVRYVLLYTGDTKFDITNVAIPKLYRLIILSNTRGEARLILGIANVTSGIFSGLNMVIDYGFANLQVSDIMRSLSQSIEIVRNISFKRLGMVNTSIINVFDLSINKSATTLILRLTYPDNRSEYLLEPYIGKPDAETLYVGGLVAPTSSIGYSLFAQYFPIILLYLAYVLVAKPRSSGALEFVLARPITRLDLYLVRYLAGILITVIASALFLLGIGIASAILIGITLDIYSFTILYLGLIAALTSFYSLCYMVASSTRSSSYLAIAIALYLLFAMFWGMIALAISYISGGGLMGVTETGYKISYLNPLSPATIFAPYYVQKHYSISTTASEDLINPILAILSPIAWIAITFTIGYIRFRKINLSS
ncbi:hypothetical protein Igag_0489 [Ignisphaera aggregans DSM 17230]|uniref:ABC transporter permease n=1 Tax=Ignisphaera aggregans (strain DSM 17230 / JCM 13409 / AQ1.S1) TaxID=583356 RepID=E0SRX7_IGNAA|nr:hypothetical protein Igag_0489 [Ignisphaera aggregans DSM 17230]